MADEMTPVVLQEIDKSPAGMMATALAAGQDLEKLERLLDLQIRYEQNEAKKAYHDAMARFKADPPEITKDKTVGYGKTTYTHASLANVCDKINKGLSAQDLSSAWTTNQSESGISVTCTITHKLGHSESTKLIADADNSGSKNKIQAIGSTISYLERYTLLALTGLATKDQDNDGISSKQQTFIEGADLNHIKKLISEVVSDKKAFLRIARAESVDEIPVLSQNKVLALLNKKKVQMAKKEAEEQVEREPGSDDD